MVRIEKSCFGSVDEGMNEWIWKILVSDVYRKKESEGVKILSECTGNISNRVFGSDN